MFREGGGGGGGVTLIHYKDVTMSAMAYQITSPKSVCPTIYSGADKKKASKLRVTGLCAGEFTVDRWIRRTKGL